MATCVVQCKGMFCAKLLSAYQVIPAASSSLVGCENFETLGG